MGADDHSHGAGRTIEAFQIQKPRWIWFGSITSFAFLGSVLALVAGTLITIGQPSDAIDVLLEIIRDHGYWLAVGRTLMLGCTAVILKIVLCLPLVWLFSRAGKSRLQSLLLLPWMIPASVSALAWLWFFYDIGGGANMILRAFGARDVDWLAHPLRAQLLCVGFNVWREVPLWGLVLGLAASRVPHGLESLTLTDSLRPGERLRLVTLPRVLPVVCALSLLSLIWFIGDLEGIWLLTRGGPGTATETLTLYAFRRSYLSQALAYGVGSYLCFLPIFAVVLFALLAAYRHVSLRAFFSD